MRTIVEVKPLSNYELLLSFDTNEQKIYDVKPLLDKGIFQQLKDIRNFNTVRVDYGTVVFLDEIDLCPDSLYMKSKKIN